MAHGRSREATGICTESTAVAVTRSIIAGQEPDCDTAAFSHIAEARGKADMIEMRSFQPQKVRF